jgi:hypothetical protein
MRWMVLHRPVELAAVTGKVAHSTRMDAFESAKQSTSLRMSILLADQSAGDLRGFAGECADSFFGVSAVE